jgi:hypothetical protein
LRVELAVDVEGAIVVAVDTDGEHVRDVVIDGEARRRMRDELIVQGERPIRLQLEATRAQREHLLHGIDLLPDGPCRLLLHIELRARCRIELADVL